MEPQSGQRIPLRMITLTENAAKEIRKIMADNDLAEDVAVRVGVKGGGCSGLTYTFDFDSRKSRFDLEFESEGLRIRGPSGRKTTSNKYRKLEEKLYGYVSSLFCEQMFFEMFNVFGRTHNFQLKREANLRF